MDDDFFEGLDREEIESAPVHQETVEHRTERRSRLFRALGDPLRLKIMELLDQAPPRGLTIGRLVELTGASQPLVSFHVRKLRDAGIVLPHWPNSRRTTYQIFGLALGEAEALLKVWGEDRRTRERPKYY